MSDLIEILRSFNRKERFFLICQALGLYSEKDEPEFKISDEFWKQLRKVIGPDIPEVPPSDVFVAMDYHLDWIAASLFLFESGKGGGNGFNNIVDGKQFIKGTQEDTDLLVAFRDAKDQDNYHTVLIEAKADSPWTNKQLESKAQKLEQIFGKDGKRYSRVTPRFLVLGPKLSEGLKTDHLPEWMKQGEKLRWLNLSNLPDKWRKVERTEALDAEKNNYRTFRIYCTIPPQ